MEFANPYQQIPPAPVPATLLPARVVATLAGTPTKFLLLPVLAGGKRYRLFTIVLMPELSAGFSRVDWYETTDGAALTNQFAVGPALATLGTPWPLVLPPTGVPLTTNRGIILSMQTVTADVTFDLTVAYSIE